MQEEENTLPRRSVVLLGALAAVTGCGGGGGGDASPPAPTPSPPSSSLTVSASAAQTRGGGSSVDLAATLRGSTNPVYWSLAGPGWLSANMGGAVRYTPPNGNELLVPETVTVTASSRELVQSTTILVSPAAGAPAPVPGTRWDVVHSPKFGFTDLRLLEDRFFAVNNLGGVLNSVDGINWTPRTTPLGSLNAITYGNGRYVAVGRNTVMKSADGDVWLDAGATGQFEYVDVAAGNGIYVAIGIGGMSASSEGASWTRVGPQDIGRGVAVAFGGGRFVAIDNSPRVHVSDDGIRWTTQSLPTTTTLHSVAHGNGRFVIAGEQSHFVSTDGAAWAATSVDLTGGYRLRFSGGRFFLMARNGVQVSSDGVVWNYTYSQGFATAVVGMAEKAGRFALADGSGTLLHGGPQLNFANALAGPLGAVTGIVAAGGQYLSVTNQGDVLRSADARSWQFVGDRMAAGFRGIAHGNGRFVAVSDGGPLALYTSPDGNQWLGVALGSPRPSLSAVTFGNGAFVAVGSNFEQVFRSTDGVNWSVHPSPIRVELTGVAYGNGRYVAVSVQGHIIVSTDGRDWTLQRTESGWLRAVAYGSSGFVAVGTARSGGGVIWVSADGLSWVASIDGTVPELGCAAFGNGQYLVAGERGALLLSNDASVWQARSAGIHPGFRAACAAAGRFVAAGGGGALVVSDQ